MSNLLTTLWFRISVSVEANECSSVMITAINSIFNTILPEGRTFDIHPFLSAPLADEWDFSHRFIPFRFPSLDSKEMYSHLRDLHWTGMTSGTASASHPSGKQMQITHSLELKANSRVYAIDVTLVVGGALTFHFGEFIRVYSDSSREALFDSVVTCFFLDTAVDLLR